MSDLNMDFTTNLNNCFSTDWETWGGLKGNWAVEDVKTYLENFSEATQQDLLGMGHVLTEYHTYQGHGSRGESRVWVRDGDLLMLEVNYPQIGVAPTEILEAWGKPEGEMDFFDGIMDYERMAKVYASKGMCLMLTMSQKFIMRVLFFNPCSYDDYFGSIAPYMHSGDRIGNRY